MKYIKRFNDVADANAQGTAGLNSPHVDVVDSIGTVNIVKVNESAFTCSFNSTTGKIENVTPVQETQPNDEIWYTSTDESIVRPTHYNINTEEVTYIEIGSGFEDFGANIVSNTYVNGKGILKFDGNITKSGSWFGMNPDTEESLDPNKLVTLSMPNSVIQVGIAFETAQREIGYGFFCCYMDNLEEVRYPNSNFNPNNPSTFSIVVCNKLKTIYLPDSLEIISSAFIQISSISYLTLPASLKTIEEAALICFGPNTNLSELIIPQNVTSIGDMAIMICNYNYDTEEMYAILEKLIMLPVIPPTLNGSLFGYAPIHQNLQIIVPAQSVDAYKTATNWSEYADYIVAQS